MANKHLTLHKMLNVSIPVSMAAVFDRFKKEIGINQRGDSYAAQKLLYLAMSQNMSGPDVEMMRAVFQGKMAHKERYIADKISVAIPTTTEKPL